MKSVVRSLLAAGVLAVALAGCDNGDLPPATKFASVKGTITDATTHAPVANATVIVDTVLSTVTDDKGVFTFDKVPAGIVDYVVRAKGYAEVSSSSNAEPGKPFELNVALRPPQL